MSPTVIGIDLGSANVRCGRAEYQGLRQPIIVPIGDSFEGIPTAFTITEPNYTHQIGADALDNYPSNVIFDSARVFCPNDTANKDDRANIYAELHEHYNYSWNTKQWEQYYSIRTEQKKFRLSVPEVVGGILNVIKLMAQTELGCPIRRAVLTVPSMAGTAHRRMLKQASEIAGLDVKLINQSTAATLAFRLHIGGHVEGIVLVFSMGARTTECSIFEFEKGQTPKLCHSDGFFNFGGESFTNRLLDAFMFHLSKKYKEKYARLCKRWAQDSEGEKVAKCKLRKEAEKVKAALMQLEETSVLLEPDIEFGSCQTSLGRRNFRGICKELAKKLNNLIVEVLKHCPKEKPIGHVMLAGASSKLFIVSELLKAHLPRATFIKMDAVPPGLAAARGAAIGAALWEAKSGTGPVPECLRRLDMPDFVYRRVEAEHFHSRNLFGIRSAVETHLIAAVGEEVPTEPFPIISMQSRDNQIKLYDVVGGRKEDQIVQKIGQCILHGSESIYFSLDENGLALVAEHPFQWIWQRNLLTEDKLERANQEMRKYNERIRRETEEAKRKGDEESRRMLERMMKEEEEEEEKRMREEEEEKKRKREEEEKMLKRNEELEHQQKTSEEWEEEGEEEKEEIEIVKMPKNIPPMNSPSHQLIPVPFECTFCRPTKPHHFYLFGSWDEGRTKMECKLKGQQELYGGGTFSWSYGATVSLNPGTYAYRFCTDCALYSDTWWVHIQTDGTYQFNNPSPPNQGSYNSANVGNNRLYNNAGSEV